MVGHLRQGPRARARRRRGHRVQQRADRRLDVEQQPQQPAARAPAQPRRRAPPRPRQALTPAQRRQKRPQLRGRRLTPAKHPRQHHAEGVAAAGPPVAVAAPEPLAPHPAPPGAPAAAAQRAVKDQRTHLPAHRAAHQLDCEAPLCQLLLIAAVDCKILHGTAHHITAPPPRASSVAAPLPCPPPPAAKPPPQMAEFTPSPTPRMHTINSVQKSPNVRPERGLSQVWPQELFSSSFCCPVLCKRARIGISRSEHTDGLNAVAFVE